MNEATKERRRQYLMVYRAEHREKANQYAKSYRASIPRNPEKQKVYKKAYAAKNVEKLRRALREWRTDNPQKYLAQKLRQKYGLTTDQFMNLLEQQKHACAICGKTSSAEKRALSVDHCHATGKVRGLLCHKCNVTIGMAQDNPAVLRAAIRYLERA